MADSKHYSYAPRAIGNTPLSDPDPRLPDGRWMRIDKVYMKCIIDPKDEACEGWQMEAPRITICFNKFCIGPSPTQSLQELAGWVLEKVSPEEAGMRVCVGHSCKTTAVQMWRLPRSVAGDHEDRELVLRTSGLCWENI